MTQAYLVKPAVVAPIIAITVIVALAFTWSLWAIIGIPFAILGTICGQPNLNLANGCLALIAVGVGLLIAIFHREIGFAIAGSSFGGMLAAAAEKAIRMVPYEGEDRYIGTWTDGNGHRIEIRMVKHREFLVSFFKNDSPVLRPWMNDHPSIDMRSQYFYDALDGSDFIVELSGSDNRYSLHLRYEEYDYLLPENGEILSTAVSGPEHGDYRLMDECSSRFLCVEHFYRVR